MDGWMGEGQLRVWCGVRGITSSLERGTLAKWFEQRGGVGRGSTLTEKYSFRLNNKSLHAHTD